MGKPYSLDLRSAEREKVYVAEIHPGPFIGDVFFFFPEKPDRRKTGLPKPGLSHMPSIS